MLRIQCLTVDADDPTGLARSWADLLFLPSTDERRGKNRLHLDLRPDDQAAYVEVALALGARPIDMGQTGNEFCILSSLAAE